MSRKYSNIVKDFYEEYWDYRKRYKHTIEKFIPVRLKIACKWIKLLNPKEKILILDVGCGEGGLGMLLRKKFKDKAIIYGIDISEEAIKLAKSFYDKIYIMDIERDSIQDTIKNVKFDYIVMLEILEHLFRPDIVLNKLKYLLKPSGYMIISIPNIAFLKYRIELLLGKFPTSYYLFHESEHLHYWTYYSFTNFLNQMGLEIIEYDGKFVFPPFSNIKSLQKVANYIGKKFPNVFGYQLIFKTRPILY